MWLTLGVKTATPVSKNQANREAIRILVQDLGYTETAARTGLKRDRLYKWGQRYGWKTAIEHSQGIVQTVQSPSQAHADSLAEHERETRLSLARYARRAAKVSEKASIKHAGLVHKVTQVAGLVHKWDSEKSNQTFTLNVLNINSLDSSLGITEPTLEAE